MKTRVTKAVKEEAKTIIDNHGYWSEEVKTFLSTFSYSAMTKINEKMQAYDKYGYGL